jgi:hypothetical protein
MSKQNYMPAAATVSQYVYVDCIRIGLPADLVTSFADSTPAVYTNCGVESTFEMCNKRLNS